MKLFLLLGLVAAASAACPNACSGHGTCGEHDMCTCYRNWMSADCSERVCQYDWSFVTTPQGDLNMDGDIYDSMLYRSTHFDDANVITADQSKTNLYTQSAPGGTWEMWPSYAVDNADEGHFYMECSNRGICDRKSGECDCFDGYEGAACRRTVCPNACSGHGTCESVKEQNSGYGLWDADKSMSCKCDAGYSAADCSERKCPVGDDPLTTGQRNENMYIDIARTGGSAISGYFQLQYVDDFGETWWTDYIAVSDYDAASGVADADAKLVQDALEGIPNGVFESVEVTAWPLVDIVPGVWSAKGEANPTVLTGAGFAAVTDLATYTVFTADDVLVTGAAGTARTTVGTVDTQSATAIEVTLDAAHGISSDITLYKSRANGIRFQLNFTKNTGNLNSFTCLVNDRFSNTEQRILSDDTTCTVTAGVAFGNGNKMSASGGTLSSTFDLAVDSKDTGAQVDDWDGNNEAASTQTRLGAGDRVTIGTTTVTLTSNFYYNKPTDTLTISSDVDVEAGELVSQGAIRGVVKAASSSGTVSVLVTKGAAFTDADVHFSKAGKQAVTTRAEGSAAAADGWALIDNSGTIAAAGGSWNADGTTENAECSNRGLCDTATGVCACFKGYTDDNCSRQSVLAA